jgi:hypothetical protein
MEIPLFPLDNRLDGTEKAFDKEEGVLYKGQRK